MASSGGGKTSAGLVASANPLLNQRPAGFLSANQFAELPHQSAERLAGGAEPAPTPSAKAARKRWAALIKQVYEVDPLLCPKCGAEMKIIGFIQRRQSEVIEKILGCCGLWEESPARAPPSEAVAVG